MAFEFKPATSEGLFLRMSIEGGPGAGKTHTSMILMDGLLRRLASYNQLPARPEFAVGDTEHGTAKLYRKRAMMPDGFTFAHDELKIGNVAEFIAYLQAAQAAGFSGTILDSTTAEWAGEDGIRSQHAAMSEKVRASKGKANDFALWEPAKKPHHAFIRAILSSRLHVIATVRSKIKHRQAANGEVEKLGYKPIQQEELPYEFDFIGRMDPQQRLHLMKSRFRAWNNMCIYPLGFPDVPKDGVRIEQFGAMLADFLSDSGEAAPAQPTHFKAELPEALAAEILAARQEIGISDERWLNSLADRGVTTVAQLSEPVGRQLLASLQAALAQVRAKRATTDVGVSTAEPTAAPLKLVGDAPAPSPPAAISPTPAQSLPQASPVGSQGPGAIPAPPTQPSGEATPEEEQQMLVIAAISGLRAQIGMPEQAWRQVLHRRGEHVKTAYDLTLPQLHEIKAGLERIRDKQAASSAPANPTAAGTPTALARSESWTGSVAGPTGTPAPSPPVVSSGAPPSSGPSNGSPAISPAANDLSPANLASLVQDGIAAAQDARDNGGSDSDDLSAHVAMDTGTPDPPKTRARGSSKKGK